ncbi:unnamed protein product [Calypogeia fissa]
MLADLECDNDDYSSDTFSDEDFRDEYDLEMYSDYYFGAESTSVGEDSEGAELMESLQITDNDASNSENEVVLDEKIWEALPRELLDKILTWLPPAAHFRLRSVCKRWKDLVCSPGWLQHYGQVRNRPSSTVMCTLRARKANFFCFSELKWFDMPLSPVTYLELDWELEDVDAGLVCFQRNWNGALWLCVCNPLTQSSRVLPPNYPHWDTQPPHCELLKLLVYRRTQTFKVVVLVHSSNPFSTVIYDSTTGLWTVHKSFPTQDFREGTSFVWKDVIYLQCFSMGKLLAFDVNSGVWSEVDTDLPCHNMSKHFLINHNDTVLLVQTSTSVVMEAISVWKLVIDASKPTVDFSRSKWVQVPISIPTYLKSLLSDAYSCFSQTDRICFATAASNKWVTYTFGTKSWHVMPARGRRDARYSCFDWEPRLDMDVESKQPEI